MSLLRPFPKTAPAILKKAERDKGNVDDQRHYSYLSQQCDLLKRPDVIRELNEAAQSLANILQNRGCNVLPLLACVLAVAQFVCRLLDEIGSDRTCVPGIL